MGRYWGVVWGRDNRLCCLWYSVGLGGGGAWLVGWYVWRLLGSLRGCCSRWGVFCPRVSIVCVCVRARARSLAHLVYLQERKKHFNKWEIIWFVKPCKYSTSTVAIVGFKFPLEGVMEEDKVRLQIRKLVHMAYNFVTKEPWNIPHTALIRQQGPIMLPALQ